MKKWILAVIAVIVIVAGGILCYNIGKKSAEKTETTEVTEAAVEAVDAEASSDETPAVEEVVIDFEKIYALHEPEETVMTVGDREITWSEYFYNFYSYANQIQEFISYAPFYYGMSVTWNDIADEATGMTYVELPTLYAEEQSKTRAGIFMYSDENGIEFDKECEAKFDEALKGNIEAVGAASEEEFYEQLQKIYVTPSVVETQFKANILLAKGFNDNYGENGEKISDKEVIKYQEDNNFMHAMHILFKDFDLSGAKIPEEDLANKKAQAEQVLAELKAITDNQKRKEKFIELAGIYNEDSASEYTFTEGEMVESFEQGVKALADYEVAIVESQYGIHIIMKLPLDPNAVDTADTSLRYIVAENDYNGKLSSFIEKLEVKFADGFVAPQIADYMN